MFFCIVSRSSRCSGHFVELLAAAILPSSSKLSAFVQFHHFHLARGCKQCHSFMSFAYKWKFHEKWFRFCLVFMMHCQDLFRIERRKTTAIKRTASISTSFALFKWKRNTAACDQSYLFLAVALHHQSNSLARPIAWKSVWRVVAVGVRYDLEFFHPSLGHLRLQFIYNFSCGHFNETRIERTARTEAKILFSDLTRVL